jgi:hypothetical protein
MSQDKQIALPDSTAVLVALWRAVHVQVDPPPHVLEDEIGLRLASPSRHGPASNEPRPLFRRGPCSLH